jgi:hypothetical protein
MMTPELAEAYRQTSYLVETDPPVCFRIGQYNPALDALLKKHGAQTKPWAFVTAHNPKSKKLSDEENKKRERDLRDRLTANGYRFLEGKGVGDDDLWPEERSVLIFNITREVAKQLGRELEQNAVVVGVLGGAPELVFCT